MKRNNLANTIFQQESTKQHRNTKHQHPLPLFAEKVSILGKQGDKTAMKNYRSKETIWTLDTITALQQNNKQQRRLTLFAVDLSIFRPNTLYWPTDAHPSMHDGCIRHIDHPRMDLGAATFRRKSLHRNDIS